MERKEEKDEVKHKIKSKVISVEDYKNYFNERKIINKDEYKKYLIMKNLLDN